MHVRGDLEALREDIAAALGGRPGDENVAFGSAFDPVDGVPGRLKGVEANGGAADDVGRDGAQACH
ncbi:hypothetical protein JYK22_20130, partial [Nonomuraea sp. RK-328]|nr:hypothetical protein [Nonomuraea sp. RK-328]